MEDRVNVQFVRMQTGVYVCMTNVQENIDRKKENDMFSINASIGVFNQEKKKQRTPKKLQNQENYGVNMDKNC